MNKNIIIIKNVYKNVGAIWIGGQFDSRISEFWPNESNYVLSFKHLHPIWNDKIVSHTE